MTRSLVQKLARAAFEQGNTCQFIGCTHEYANETCGKLKKRQQKWQELVVSENAPPPKKKQQTNKQPFSQNDEGNELETRKVLFNHMFKVCKPK